MASDDEEINAGKIRVEVEKLPKDWFKRTHTIFTMLGVLVSTSVLLLAICTFRSQKEFNRRLLSPDLTLDLLPFEKDTTALAGYFLQIEGSNLFMVRCEVKNLGEKTVRSLSTFADIDSVAEMEMPKSIKLDKPATRLALAPGATEGLEQPVAIPPAAMRKGTFFLHFWVKYTSVLDESYVFHKAYEVEWKGDVAFHEDSITIKNLSVNLRIRLSERIP